MKREPCYAVRHDPLLHCDNQSYLSKPQPWSRPQHYTYLGALRAAGERRLRAYSISQTQRSATQANVLSANHTDHAILRLIAIPGLRQGSAKHLRDRYKPRQGLLQVVLTGAAMVALPLSGILSGGREWHGLYGSATSTRVA